MSSEIGKNARRKNVSATARTGDTTMNTTTASGEVVTEAAGNANLNNTTAGSNVNVEAGRDATLNATSAENDVNVKAEENVTLDSTAAANVNTNAANGSATLRSTGAGRNVNVLAGRNATLYATSAGNNVNVSAAANTVMNTTSAANVNAEAVNGNAALSNTTASDNVSVTAGNDVTLTDTNASVNVTATAGNDTVLSNTAASGNVAVSAGNDAALNSTRTSGDVTVNTGKDAKLNSTRAANDVTVTAGNDAAMTETAAGNNVTVTTGRNSTLDTTEAGNNTEVKAGKDAKLSGTKATNVNTEANGSATLNDTAAGNQVTVNAGEILMIAGTTAEDLTATATGDLTVGEMNARTAAITAGGAIDQKAGTVLSVNGLTVKAAGNIGTEGAMLTIRTDEIMATGSNVYLNNRSGSLMIHDITGETVKIETAGDINTFRDGLITAKVLDIHAIGYIGQKDARLKVSVSNELDLKSEAGEPWFENEYWPTLTDHETGISVYGHFELTAQLTVLTTAAFAKELYPEDAEALLKEIAAKDAFNFTGGCPKSILQLLTDRLADGACELLWKLIADGRTMYDFVLKISVPYCGSKVSLRIPLAGLNPEYQDELEGQKVYVLISANGKLICTESIVENGTVKAILDELGISGEHPQYTQAVILSEDEFKKLREEGLIPDEALRDPNGNVLPVTVQANTDGENTENI